MATSELVTLRNLALLSNIDDHALVDSRAQFVVTINGIEHLHTDDGSLLTVGNLEGRVANLARLLVEDCTEQALFSAELRLTLRGNFSDQDVTGANLSTDADDAALIQVGKKLRTNVGEVSSDFFLTELGIAGVNLILLDVNL